MARFRYFCLIYLCKNIKLRVDKMKRFFHSSSFKTLVVIAVVVLLGVLCAAVSHNASSPFTTAVGTIFSPLQKLSAAIEENLGDVSSAFTSSSVYKEENEALRKELEEYRVKLLWNKTEKR